MPPQEDKPARSILEFLKARSGHQPRVALRQEDSVPVLKPVEGLVETGKYQLQGEIARGGVGIVLKGHDTELGRDVALKLIREDYADHQEVIGRFIEEAQIGGQLQHPGIVPVYDLGLQEGRPFFTMKLIKGRTLAALLEERQESRRSLLTIYEAVCHTMAYAHSRGVIHRDLKPANVMVGAFGEVQVVDWGMGKVLRSGGVEDERRSLRAQETIVATLRSESASVGSDSIVGSAMGTPAYMPPEQARGDVDNMDERSDVFSLGAILVEILTGKAPYLGKGHEIIPLAARGDLEACHQRLAACDADEELKSLAAECLVAAREARPRNAAEVAKRIGEYLASLEEKAHAAQIEAAEERVRLKEAKRKQRLTLALAGSVLVTIVVGGGGWWWWARQKAERESKVRERFEALVREAGGVGDPKPTLAAVARARDILGDGEVSMAASVVQDLERVERRARDALEQARLRQENEELLARLQQLRGPSVEDDRFIVDWADTDQRFRAAFAQYGLAPDEASPEEAAAQLQARGAPDAFALALDDWTFIRREAGAAEGARRLAEIASRLDGDTTRRRLRTAMLAGDVAVLEQLAAEARFDETEPRTLYLLGESLQRLSDPQTIYEFHRSAHNAHPTDFYIAHGLARAMYKMASRVGGVSHAMAVRCYFAARALRPDNYVVNVELAQQYINAQEYVAAESLLRRMLRERPEDPILVAELGLVTMHRGNLPAAQRLFEESIRLDPERVWPRRIFSIHLRGAGRNAEALEQARRAVELSPAGRRGSAWSYSELGQCLYAVRKHREAQEAFERAAALDGEEFHHRLYAAYCLHAQVQTDEALAVLRGLLKAHAAHPAILASVAQARKAFGHLDEALELTTRALATMPEIGNGQYRAHAYGVLADVHKARGEIDLADAARERQLAINPRDTAVAIGYASELQQRQLADRAVDVLERVLRVEPMHLQALWHLAGLRYMAGRYEDALALQERFLDVYPGFPMAHGAKAEALIQLGRAEEGLQSARRAVELDGANVSLRAVLAMLLNANAKHDDALQELANIPVNSWSDVAWYQSGFAKRGLGRTEEALGDFTRCTELNPRHVEAHLARAGILSDRHRLEDALQAARSAQAAAPRDGRPYFVEGNVLGRLGRFGEAETRYRQGLELDPSDLRAQIEVAWLAAEAGRYGETIRELRTLLAARPNEVAVKRSLAWALVVLPLADRSTQEALALARSAQEVEPGVKETILAGALFRAGDHEEAERVLERLGGDASAEALGVQFVRALNLLALGRNEAARRHHAAALRLLPAEDERPSLFLRLWRDEAAKRFDER